MDKRALKILMDAFWSPAGWKPETMRDAPGEDFEYAKSRGAMFDPVMLDHASVQAEITALIQRLDRRRVADAFLASLSTRRLDWRSAFGSYVVFQHMPHHAEPSAGRSCSVCGMYSGRREEDLSLLNFERFKWGGVRHDHPGYAAFDLGQFLRGTIPSPTAEDVRIFHGVIDAIRTAPAETTSAAVQSRLPGALKSNKAERDVLVALFGFAGILDTPGHPGYSDAYVPVTQRQLPDRHFVDMSYPACWWKASYGLNQVRLSEYFGHVL